MPSTSAKQAKFMRAVAHSPKFAKKVGVPQSVGKDFEMADKKKAKKFGDGGTAQKAKRREPTIREPVTGGPNTVPLTPERREFLKELEKRNKEAAAEAAARAKRATPYAKGGKVMKKAPAFGKAMAKKSADTKGRAMKKYAEGDVVKSGTANVSGVNINKPGGFQGMNMADRAARMQGRYDRMDARFDDRLARMQGRLADMPADRQDAMKTRIANMQSRFDDRLANLKARIPGTGTNTAANTSTTTGGTAAATTTTAKKGGKIVKKAMGGMATTPTRPGFKSKPKGKGYAKGGGIEVKGKTKGTMVKMNKGGKCYAKGGSVDGCAVRGKTRAPMQKGK